MVPSGGYISDIKSILDFLRKIAIFQEKFANIFFEGDFYTKLTHASLHNDTFNSFLTIESQKKPQTQP